MAKHNKNEKICVEDETIDDAWNQEEKILSNPTAKILKSFTFDEAKKEPDNAKTTILFSNEAKNNIKGKSISEKSRDDIIFNNYTVGIIENDKEPYDCKRNYALRKSTVKMLNELKGFNLDVNISIGNIVDDAIRFYYNYVTNKL